MARMSSIKGAYAKPNPGSRSGGAGRYALIAGGLFALVLLLSHGRNSATPSSASSKKNSVPSVASLRADQLSYQANQEERERAEEEKLDAFIENAESTMQNVESEEVEKDEEIVDTSLESTYSYIQSLLSKWFGNKLDEETASDISNEVEDVLSNAVKNEYRERAENVYEEQMAGMEEAVQVDQYEGLKEAEIESDVEEQEQEAESAIREGVYQAATELSQPEILRKRAEEIEIKILEQRLSEKLKKKVKLTIEDDQIKDIDKLLEGLPNLGGSPPPPLQTEQSYGNTGSTPAEATRDDGGALRDDHAGGTDDDNGW